MNVVSTNLISWQSRSLKQWLLSCRFLRRLVVNDHLNILNCLCNVFVVDLACYFETWQIVLEKVVKELKLLKAIVTSRYWRSWWPFNKAFHKLCYDGQWPLTCHYFKHCLKLFTTNTYCENNKKISFIYATGTFCIHLVPNVGLDYSHIWPTVSKILSKCQGIS